MADDSAVIDATEPTGQLNSHAPHPIQASSFTTGISVSDPSLTGTIVMAPAGQ